MRTLLNSVDLVHLNNDDLVMIVGGEDVPPTNDQDGQTFYYRVGQVAHIYYNWCGDFWTGVGNAITGG